MCEFEPKAYLGGSGMFRMVPSELQVTREVDAKMHAAFTGQRQVYKNPFIVRKHGGAEVIWKRILFLNLTINFCVKKKK